jgi:hypothetical protein
MGATDIVGAQAPSRSAPSSQNMVEAQADISYLQYARTLILALLYLPHPLPGAVCCGLPPPFYVPAPTGRPLRRSTAHMCTVS